MYALFITDPIHNTTTFARGAPTEQQLIQWALVNVANTAWFAVYKLVTLDDQPFGDNVIKASKWRLHTTFAGSTATNIWRDYKPMSSAYSLDNDHNKWFFKTL